MIKIATVCSGIGSPEVAMKNLGIAHEIPFACEIDGYARRTYLANHKPKVMYHDMTQEAWDKPEQYSDLFVGGIPCQAFSLAGKKLGELDPRGLLFFDFYRYVKNQQPKVFIIENVKGLLSDAGGSTFQNWCALLGQSMNTHLNMFNHPDSLGYNLHFKVLNLVDYNLPQNRERVFLVGIRNDLPNTFRFPKTQPLKVKLKDLLEPVVDPKYFLSDRMIAGLVRHNENSKEKGRGFNFAPIPFDTDEPVKCIRANCHKMGPDDNFVLVARERRTEEAKAERRQRGNNGFRGKELIFEEQEYMNCLQTSPTNDNLIKVGQISLPGMFESAGRVYSTEGIAPTLTTKTGGGHEPYFEIEEAIRRLTPTETLRLMGFDTDTFDTAGNSDTQIYRQSGNSIGVTLMQAIIQNLLPVLKSVQ